MKKSLALLLFIPLQIVFIPVAISGALLVAYRQLIVSRRLGVSQTAVEILNGRWTMHIFGLRQDPAAAKLAAVLPNTSTFGLWLVLTPLYVYSRLTGSTRFYPVIAPAGEEKLTHLVLNRTGYIDALIEKTRPAAAQFVILGAGLDTRAYNMLKASQLKIFELDQAAEQQHKLSYLHKAGIDTTHVTFVESDFSSEAWFSSLVEAGYDPSQRTIFLWEGVTLYLSEAAVRRTLQQVQANAAAGSRIIADFYAKRFVTGEYAPGLKATLPILVTTDEQLGFGLEMAHAPRQVLEAFVAGENLTLREAYFMGTKTQRGTWMAVAELQL